MLLIRDCGGGEGAFDLIPPYAAGGVGWRVEQGRRSNEAGSARHKEGRPNWGRGRAGGGGGLGWALGGRDRTHSTPSTHPENSKSTPIHNKSYDLRLSQLNGTSFKNLVIMESAKSGL